MWLPDIVRRGWRGARNAARSVIGVPDYEGYLRHCREHHPQQPPMDYAAFFNNRQAARYRGTGGRCC